MHIACLLGLLFNPEDGANTFTQNIYMLLPDYKACIPEIVGIFFLVTIV
jgi:hypothetical protein